MTVTIFFNPRLIGNMKKIYLPLLFMLLLVIVPAADPTDTVATLIGQGNTHELAKYFAQSVEVTIVDAENVYTKTQAELVLDKFFSQNKPQGAKILHKVTSNPNYRFAVLILTTDKGTYRVAYTMKETDGRLALIELRIETEKVK